MTDKHEVTVYDRVPAMARVSARQIDAYLGRTGWARVTDGCGDIAAWWRDDDRPVSYVEVPLRESWRDWAQRAGECVERIAAAEKRKAADVLADIAKEPA